MKNNFIYFLLLLFVQLGFAQNKFSWQGYFSYNEIKAVSNLCLDIPEGELFCLLGHNGAGKSTTINLLTGMLNASEGNISIFGLDFQKNLDFIRKKIK